MQIIMHVHNSRSSTCNHGEVESEQQVYTEKRCVKFQHSTFGEPDVPNYQSCILGDTPKGNVKSM